MFLVCSEGAGTGLGRGHGRGAQEVHEGARRQHQGWGHRAQQGQYVLPLQKMSRALTLQVFIRQTEPKILRIVYLILPPFSQKTVFETNIHILRTTRSRTLRWRRCRV